MNISTLLVENWRSFINEQDASLGEELLQIIQGIQVVVIGADGEPVRPLEFESAAIKEETGTTVHITNVGSRGERQQLMNALAEKFPEDIEPLTTSDGDTFRLGKYKGKKFQLYQGSVGLRIANKGDAAEGILGATIMAPLLGYNVNRGSAAKVSMSDVLAILESLDRQPDKNPRDRKTSKELKFQGDIQKSLKIALNVGNFNDLMNEEKRPILAPVYDQILRYVNSNYFLDFLKSTVFSPEPFELEVLVVGAEEQMASKADVRIEKDGIPIWSHSLKLGSRQLGQVGGKSADKVFEFVTKVFGFEASPERKKQYSDMLTSLDGDSNREKFYNASSLVFIDLYRYMKRQLSGDQAAYTEKLLNSLKQSAISDESNIDVLNIEKSTFRLLDFEQIREILNYIDLDVDLSAGKTGYPIITVFSRGAQGVVPRPSNILFRFRPKFENSGPVLRFLVEYGNLVDTMLSKYEEEQEENS